MLAARAAGAECLVLGVLLLAALLVRVVALEQVESGLLAPEADDVAAIIQARYGPSPGWLAAGRDGEPRLTLLPATLLSTLIGHPSTSLRLTGGLASLLGLLAFYRLSRRDLTTFAALSATALLAFASWHLFIARAGSKEIWALPVVLGAGLFTRRAIASEAPRDWRLAGLCCGLSWFAGQAALVCTPVVLLTLAGAAASKRLQPRPAAIGAATILVLAGLLALVRLLGGGFGPAAEPLPLLDANRPPAASGDLLARIVLSLRAFVLLDPSPPGDGWSFIAGAPVVDSLTGTLYFVGLLLGTLGRFGTPFWWLLLGAVVLIVQPHGRYIPDGGLALPALPAIAFTAGLTIDWLLRRELLGPPARLAVLFAVPAAAIWNVTHYVEWQRLPTTAAARQPTVEWAELDAWQAVQREAVQAGRPPLTMADWLSVRDQFRPVTASRPAVRFASSAEVRPAADFAAVGGLRRPRGAALGPDGVGYVLDVDGRVLKLDPTGKVLAIFGSSAGGPVPEDASDLALEPAGTLLVLDAGRGRIDRYDPNGRFLTTLGADWGMYRPRGLTVGPDGRIYVADTGRNRVVISGGAAADAVVAEVDQPTDVALDARGWLFVVQPDISKLKVLDAELRTRATWNVGHFNTVDGPHLAYLEAGALVVGDPEKRRVQLFDLEGRPLAQVGGENEPLFGLPYGLAAAGDRLLVADAGRPSVRAFTITAR